MAKKTISKVSDKLDKVNESFTVNMYDNGYMFEINGSVGPDDDWKTVKLMVIGLDDLISLIKEVSDMPKRD